MLCDYLKCLSNNVSLYYKYIQILQLSRSPHKYSKIAFTNFYFSILDNAHSKTHSWLCEAIYERLFQNFFIKLYFLCIDVAKYCLDLEGVFTEQYFRQSRNVFPYLIHTGNINFLSILLNLFESSHIIYPWAK